MKICYIKKIVCFLFVFTFIASILTSCFEDDVFYTEDIANYSSYDYPIGSTFFLSELPENAKVVSFSNYCYWHEIFDVYLELKFNTEEEISEYISSLKNRDLSSATKNNRDEPSTGWIVEQKNPYNNSYIDLISTESTVSSADESWVGYQINIDEEKTIIKAHVSIISYSYDELTVIQSYMSGFYNPSANDHVFKYFIRFNIPTDHSHKRVVIVK